MLSLYLFTVLLCMASLVYGGVGGLHGVILLFVLRSCWDSGMMVCFCYIFALERCLLCLACTIVPLAYPFRLYSH
ncbi:hypothetical protein FN846DRAFT_951079 [Sphaerosporella brunnea]|uniref:Secreted peptide n=1 Tax=Sphaerosporella brunnea TaxID=1250544 RepID=A0A5J5EWX2_9PEZI|nr:hypothetical protein FN846DRAFT_951079 [Sphaerosporella brunnea]